MVSELACLGRGSPCRRRGGGDGVRRRLRDAPGRVSVYGGAGAARRPRWLRRHGEEAAEDRRSGGFNDTRRHGGMEMLICGLGRSGARQ